MNRVILNTPCLPKRSYHVGNAISQVVTDIVFRYSRYLNVGKVFYVNHAWNLFGLVYENMVHENLGKFDYNEAMKLAKNEIKKAEKEKELISDYKLVPDSKLISYTDVDPDFIDYCIERINHLNSLGYVIKIAGEYYLNLEKYFNSNGTERLKQALAKIKIYPEFQAGTIFNQIKTLNKYYPLTKKRHFSMKLEMDGQEYSLNPIFQSLLMPAYICKISNSKLPAYFQASSSGHSMLKWHYLRILLSDILFDEIPYQHLFLHGNILGIDGKPMSKHAGNVLQPSDIYEILNDKKFVRYVLVKSISFKDVAIQIELAKAEYQKIRNKLKEMENADVYAIEDNSVMDIVQKGLTSIDAMNFKSALEYLYLSIKKVKLTKDQVNCSESLTNSLRKLKEILL